jgi:hypothetical protein
MKKKKKLKPPIDTMIVDLILDHFNIQMLQGERESLSGDEFMTLIEIAELQYYSEVISKTEVGMA